MLVAAQDLGQDDPVGQWSPGTVGGWGRTAILRSWLADPVFVAIQLFYAHDQGCPQNRYRSHKMR